MEKIPLFIVEEHHEAFFIWHYARLQGLIPDAGNVLLHVDEHSDFAVPRFNTSIKTLNGDLDTLADFTYKELDIASFIIPTIYQGLINHVLWLRQQHHPKARKHYTRYVRSFNAAGKRLMSGVDELQVEDPDRNEAIFDLITLDELPADLPTVILDIDLDFFSAVDNPSVLKEVTVEITQDEYERFSEDKYHPLQFYGMRVEARHDNGHFFYDFNNYNEIYPSRLTVEEAKIVERLDLFAEALAAQNVQPAFIDICRSKYSGFTPNNQCEFIQEELLKRLAQLYPLGEAVHVSALVESVYA